MLYFQPVLGMIFMVGLCLLLSRDRRMALRQWRIVVWGLGLQLAFAVLVLRTPVGKPFFTVVNNVFLALIGYANEGAQFVFGDLADPARQVPVFDDPKTLAREAPVFAFAFLTLVIFFASLMAILYHLRIMQWVVRAVAWVMARTMGTSGSESLVAAGNIFVGMTEAPLMVRPFIPGLTRSELMAVMTAGFATIAGTVMGLYINILKGVLPGIAGHLMAASIMSAPAALVFAKILYPETEPSETAGTIRVKMDSPYDTVIDAAAGGAAEGMKLFLNILAMLIAFVALVAMVNGLLGAISGWIAPNAEPATIQKLFGWLFCPLAWLMGIPASESVQVGQLMGTKTILNEFLAYLDLVEMAPSLCQRSGFIASYALCGFANLGSVGITIGGLTIMAPKRRTEIARLGIPAMLAGFLACNMTACIAALLIPAGQALAQASTP